MANKLENRDQEQWHQAALPTEGNELLPAFPSKKSVTKFLEGQCFYEQLAQGNPQIILSKLDNHREMGSIIMFGQAVMDGRDTAVVLRSPNPEKCHDIAEYGSPLERHAKQLWVTAALKERAIPVAETIAHGTTEIDGVEWPWSMERRIDGRSPTKDEAGGRLELWKLLGTTLRSLHEIHPVGFGKRFNAQRGEFRLDWASCLEEELNAAGLRTSLIPTILGEDAVAALEARFGELRDLDRRYPVCLNHMDLSPFNNMMITHDSWKGGRPASLAGVLDFDFASGLPGSVFDLAMIPLSSILFPQPQDHRILPAQERLHEVLSGMEMSVAEYTSSQLERDVTSVVLLKTAGWLRYYAEDLTCNKTMSIANINNVKRLRDYLETQVRAG